MKKICVMLLVVVLLFVACSNNSGVTDDVKSNNTLVEYKMCTIEQYTAVMDSKGYSCAYYSADDLKGLSGIEYAVVAQPYSGYLIEYYVFNSLDDAVIAYNEGTALADVYGVGVRENMAVDTQLSYVGNFENGYYRYFLYDNVLTIVSTRLAQYKEDAEEVSNLLIQK